MKNLLYYLGTAIIWGSTWLAIKFQLGNVAPALSVAYRFALAGLILLLFCLMTGRKLRYTIRDYFFVALQGIFLFNLNYLLVYLAEQQLSSGLVAVIFSLVVFFNIINEAIFFKIRLRLLMIIGALLGLTGIALVFKPEIIDFSPANKDFIAILWCLLGALFASFGNILSARNQKAGLPVIQTNALSMTFSALLMLLISIMAGYSFTFECSAGYIISLLYLAIFGSVIAFGLFLSLIGRIGAGKAGYVTLVIPVFALLLSSCFEKYTWTPWSVIGLILIVTGNLLILLNKLKKTLPAR
ncbi:MAG TPA: EamA family transporter [bacterium]|nr:EamA family transporter [bacterium]HPN43561.1 EamA family transporter [bacterium]